MADGFVWCVYVSTIVQCCIIHVYIYMFLTRSSPYSWGQGRNWSVLLHLRLALQLRPNFLIDRALGPIEVHTLQLAHLTQQVQKPAQITHHRFIIHGHQRILVGVVENLAVRYFQPCILRQRFARSDRLRRVGIHDNASILILHHVQSSSVQRRLQNLIKTHPILFHKPYAPLLLKHVIDGRHVPARLLDQQPQLSERAVLALCLGLDDDGYGRRQHGFEGDVLESGSRSGKASTARDGGFDAGFGHCVLLSRREGQGEPRVEGWVVPAELDGVGDVFGEEGALLAFGCVGFAFVVLDGRPFPVVELVQLSLV